MVTTQEPNTQEEVPYPDVSEGYPEEEDDHDEDDHDEDDDEVGIRQCLVMVKSQLL